MIKFKLIARKTKERIYKRVIQSSVRYVREIRDNFKFEEHIKIRTMGKEDIT